jgi:transposase InsO family protein
VEARRSGCAAAAAQPKAGAGHRAGASCGGGPPQRGLVPGLRRGSDTRGGKLRILCVTDEFTRESLTIEVGRSFRSERVCTVLEQLMSDRGRPGALRMDNGPEFVALALRGLCHRRGIDPAYIEPGKPWQNGFAESFISRLRDEFLDGEVFLSVLEAQVRWDCGEDITTRSVCTAAWATRRRRSSQPGGLLMG